MASCDKCGGLVVQVDRDELMCAICSKRWYLENVQMGFCHEPGCTSQTRGAYCREHSGDTDACRSVIKPEHIDLPKKRYVPKPLSPSEIDQVNDARQKVLEAIHKQKSTVEVSRQGVVTLPTEFVPLRPVHVAFVVCLDDPDKWIQFGETWKQHYANFQICHVEPEQKDFEWCVMLQLK